MKDCRGYISVLDASTTLSGLDDFGPVSSGFLSIKCSALVRAELLDSGRSEENLGQEGSGRHQFVTLEAVAFPLPVLMDVLEDEWDCYEVYLLPLYGELLGSSQSDHKGEEKHRHVTGLVLRACGKDADNERRFSRVGSFCSFNSRFGLDKKDKPRRNYCEDFIRILDVERSKAAEAECSGTLFNRDCFESWINITIE